jgi:hypothetical protein
MKSLSPKRARAGSSVWHERRIRNAEVAGSNPARSTSLEHKPVSVKEAVFRTVSELRKEGHSSFAVEGYGNRLEILSKIADLNCPESVREAIAGKNSSVAYQEALTFAYCHYVRVNGLIWNPPCCKRQRGAMLDFVHSSVASRSVRAREIGKLARKHRNSYSLQQVYEIVGDIW